MTNRSRILSDVLDTLWERGGRPEPTPGGDDILGLLIRMILAQATSKSNATRAFGELVDGFQGDWAKVCAAPTDDIAHLIAVGGLANQKAPRIQKVLARAHADFGAYTLEPLRDWEPDAALAYVLAFDGVGPTTARFTLMVAAGMDLFPMNGGVRRVLTRIGVLEGGESDAVAHAMVASMLADGTAYAAHMTLVDHARKTCKPVARCDQCAACDVCPSIAAARSS